MSETSVAGVDGRSMSLKMQLCSLVPIVLVETTRRGRFVGDNVPGKSGSIGRDNVWDCWICPMFGMAEFEGADGGTTRLGVIYCSSAFL